MRQGTVAILLVFFLLLLPNVTSQSMAATCSPSPPVQIVGNESEKPASIQSAYNTDSTPGTVIELRLAGDDFVEDLIFNIGPVILDGGWDSTFQSKTTTPTTIQGTITIRDPGSLIVTAEADFPTVISTTQTQSCAFDGDGDGYYAIGLCDGVGDDCNDNNPNINPGAVDIPYDGIDQDCSGLDLRFAEDFLPQQENCGICHGIDRTQWDNVHAQVPAPDPTCATCHNALVTNILSGHYGKTVRTTSLSNNMNAGEIIVCNSCHDQISGEHNFGNNTVMAKVFTAWTNNNLSCDTCHDTRATDHATVAAHNNRVIDNSCGQCHDPLATQADVDALHRSDCALCHNYPGTLIDAELVRQAVEDGIGGAQVSCTACHSAHHSQETNQVFYNPSVGIDTSQPSETGCAECHNDYDITNGTSDGLNNWEAILVEHDLDGIKDGSPNTCANCHEYDGSASAPLADVQNAIASGGCVTCATCHTDKVPNISHGAPTSGKHAGHLELPGITSCSKCHSNAPYFQSGIDANSDGLYDLAETDVCDPCHQDWDPAGLPAERDYKAGWYDAGFSLECNYCHAEDVDNGDTIPAGGRRAVEGEFPVADPHAHYGTVLDSASCQVCHDHTNHSDGTINLLDPDGGAGYDFVYPSDLTSDPDASDFCANCHDIDGATRLVAPLDPLDPFANGNSAPDVASRFMGTVQWYEYYGDFCFGYEGSNRPVNSHHDISDADQAFSGAKIECLDCHGAHSSAASQKVTDPLAANVPWTGTLNEFCLSCHTGDHGPNDLILPAEVSVPTFYTEPPANIPGEVCGAGMVYDCAGVCAAESVLNPILGDGSCDAVLDCGVFNFDNDDCRPLNTPNTSCGTNMVYDCADNCVAQADVDLAAGGMCDEDPATLDLNCPEFGYDYTNFDPLANGNPNGYCNPCIGNECTSVGGIDSCSYAFGPWWIDASWTNAPHGGDSKRQWPGYSGAPTVPEMECIACHDSHGSYDAVTNPGGNPYMLRDYVQGSQFLDDSARPLAGDQDPANWHPGTDGPVIITNPTPENIGPQLGNQFCVKCHSDWVAAYSWHAYDCTGCLTCHSHGAAWGTSDWGDAPADQKWCP